MKLVFRTAMYTATLAAVAFGIFLSPGLDAQGNTAADAVQRLSVGAGHRGSKGVDRARSACGTGDVHGHAASIAEHSGGVAERDAGDAGAGARLHAGRRGR